MADEVHTMSKPLIRFVDTLNQTLFHIEDGGKIEIAEGSKVSTYTCRYIDECHTQIGGFMYHIAEFAEYMERNSWVYRPARHQENAMYIVDFVKMKKLERYARINGPLMELLNEQWSGCGKNDPAYIETLNRVQAVSQELFDLINAGLL